MIALLLDTNVLSEATRPQPEPKVMALLAGDWRLHLSAITLHELRFGVERLPAGRRRAGLEAWLQVIEESYGEAILPVDRGVADAAARFRASAAVRGLNLRFADALIAGTAAVHGLTLATRNVVDFDGLPIQLIDPWAASV